MMNQEYPFCDFSDWQGNLPSSLITCFCILYGCEVGSGGPRALRKVLKRALARVDPLKKVLLRVSALA